jgi:hypothetical protein
MQANGSYLQTIFFNRTAIIVNFEIAISVQFLIALDTDSQTK